MPPKPKRRLLTAFPLVLDEKSAQPLYQQLYEQLRQAILRGQLNAGKALPSTRHLAKLIGVSRTTVIEAYDQLMAEGYLHTKIGAGTYVTNVLPDDYLQAKPTTSQIEDGLSAARSLSPLGTYFKDIHEAQRQHNQQLPYRFSTTFPIGIPALDLFPLDSWQRILTQCYRATPHRLLFSDNALGYGPLREVLAEHLRLSRAVKCTAHQIMIVQSSQQAISLAAHLLLKGGDSVWMEDPGYILARRALESSGAQPISIPVDQDGLDVERGIATCPTARLAYVTPSHQFPLGGTLKLARRLMLLNWAKRVGAWIIEDDYDSELRFNGRPLPALQGLDTDQRVIYIGTFNKVLFPSLRIAYMVLPPDLVGVFAHAHAISGGLPPLLEQAALMQFITNGLFERHIRRMRAAYAERQQALLDYAKALTPWLQLSPSDAGMHLVGWLSPTLAEQEVARRAAEYGVTLLPLSMFSSQLPLQQAVLLGYGLPNQAMIQHGVQQLLNMFNAL